MTALEDGDGEPLAATIDALLHQQGHVDGAVLQVGPATWAIHATIPVDGEVIVAEFDLASEARAALEHLPPDV